MNGMRRRVTRRSVAAWSCSLGSRAEALHLAVTEAGDEVVVHHPHSLHEGIADGRPDKAEATLDERRAHRGIHFLAIADDPRILQKLRDLLAIVVGYTLVVEPVEPLEEPGAFVQHD